MHQHVHAHIHSTTQHRYNKSSHNIPSQPHNMSEDQAHHEGETHAQTPAQPPASRKTTSCLHTCSRSSVNFFSQRSVKNDPYEEQDSCRTIVPHRWFFVVCIEKYLIFTERGRKGFKGRSGALVSFIHASPSRVNTYLQSANLPCPIQYKNRGRQFIKPRLWQHESFCQVIVQRRRDAFVREKIKCPSASLIKPM
jgi:hypothetical protein